LVVMGVRWKTRISELDAPAIEELTFGRDRNEQRRVTVLGNADDRASRAARASPT
jgi:hypothetical protein